MTKAIEYKMNHHPPTWVTFDSSEILYCPVIADMIAGRRPTGVEILAIAHEMKFLRIAKVSVDGTKVEANASKHQALSHGHACKLEKQLEAEVAVLLKRAGLNHRNRRNALS